MAVCTHCKTEPVVRHVQTSLPGTKAVDLALCDCDFARCQAEGGCGKPLRNVPMHVHRCPHCAVRL
jgi:hypothetical protein